MANPKFLSHLLPAPKTVTTDSKRKAAARWYQENKPRKPSKWGYDGGTVQGKLNHILNIISQNKQEFTAQEVGKEGNWTTGTAAGYLKQRDDVKYNPESRNWRFV